MPPARCSNCGRFMNAIAGCRNPRCCTSDTESDDSDPFTSRRKSSFVYECDSLFDTRPSRDTRQLFSSEYSAVSRTTRVTAPSAATSRTRELEPPYDSDPFTSRRKSSFMYECDSLFDTSPSRDTRQLCSSEYSAVSRAPAVTFPSAVTSRTRELETSYADISAALQKISSDMQSFIIDQKSLNQHFNSRLVVLENLPKKVEDLASELKKQSIIADRVRILESTSNENYRQLSSESQNLKATIALVVSAQEKLITADKRIMNEQVELQHKLAEVGGSLDKQRAVIYELQNLKTSHADISAALEEISSRIQRFASEQKSLNQHFTSKLAVLKNLQDQVKDLASEMNEQSSITEDVRTLESSSDEKYRQLSAECKNLKATIALVVSDQEKLITADKRIMNEQVELQHKLEEVGGSLDKQRAVISELQNLKTSHTDISAALEEISSRIQRFPSEQKSLNQHFTSKLAVLGNLQDQVKDLASEMNEQSSITEDVRILASSSDEKYRELSTKCENRYVSIAYIVLDQKKLVTADIGFINEQVKLQHKLEEVENALTQRSVWVGRITRGKLYCTHRSVHESAQS